MLNLDAQSRPVYILILSTDTWMLKQDASEDAHGCPSTPCILHSHWSPNTGPFVEWLNELNKFRLRVSLDTTCFYPDRQTLAAQCQDLIPKRRPLLVLVSQVSFPSTLRLLLGPPVGARKEPPPGRNRNEGRICRSRTMDAVHRKKSTFSHTPQGGSHFSAGF